MPRKRKLGNRKAHSRLFILCEGEKTEPNYFEKLIQDHPRQRLVEVTVIRSKFNTNNELVEEAKSYKDLPEDQVWVVVDKDGYTRHPQAFNKARDNNIKLAFSSISFEFWILLHFEYTTRAFAKSAEIISHLKHEHHFQFLKNDRTLYRQIKDNQLVAQDRAKKVRKYMTEGGGRIYTLNPYTNVDQLVEAIEKLLNPPACT